MCKILIARHCLLFFCSLYNTVGFKYLLLIWIHYILIYLFFFIHYFWNWIYIKQINNVQKYSELFYFFSSSTGFQTHSVVHAVMWKRRMDGNCCDTGTTMKNSITVGLSIAIIIFQRPLMKRSSHEWTRSTGATEVFDWCL